MNKNIIELSGKTFIKATACGEGFKPDQPGFVRDKTGDCDSETRKVNNEWYFDIEGVAQHVLEKINSAPKGLSPVAKAVVDAKASLEESLTSLANCHVRFNADVKRMLEDIRETKFSVVRETADISAPLKEIRQFFLASDYKEEVARLRDFVELCERLQKLKDSGFLDSVAGTMLRLAEPESK